MIKFVKKTLYRFNAIYSSMLGLGISFYYSSFEYRKLMKINKIQNIKQPFEDLYYKKWSALSKYVSYRYFRLFSNYIGHNPNIVPEDICHNIIEQILNPPVFRGFYEDKNFFDKIFPLDILPRTILRRIQGYYYSSNYEVVNSIDNIDIINNDSASKIIIKPTVESSSGKGVFLFERNDQGFFCNVMTSEIFDIDNIEQLLGKDFIIQECLKQSSFMSQFNPTSVNTLRVLAYRSVVTNEIVIPNVIMRIGGLNSIVDNSHAGGRSIGVDSKGKLNNYLVDQFGKRTSSFNDISFENDIFIIPNFENIISFSKEIASQIIHHRVVNLDIMLDSEGNPRLIEFNIRAMGVWVYQFNNGPAFGKYTDEIIDYCKDNMSDINRVNLTMF